MSWGEMSRVLLVGKGPPDRGGISAFLQALTASRLADMHDIRLLNLSREEVPRSGRVTTRNVSRTLRDAMAVWHASSDRVLAHIHTALVPHVTLLRVGLLALAARARRCVVVVHVHNGHVPSWLSTRTRRLLAKACLWPAHRVVSVDEPSRAALAAVVGQGRSLLIENGVDTGAYGEVERPARTRPQILYAGVLTPRKGLLDLFEASAILRERGLDHGLVLAGGTPDEGPEAEAQVRAAAPAHAVFLGPLPHERMAAVYREADVFCLPSWWEAMPLSLLEAMAAGLAVVATLVGDIPRAVQDGTSGRLVPPRAPEELAKALEELLIDSTCRRRLGVAARRRAADAFDHQVTVTAIDELYRTLASKGSFRRS